MFQIVSESFLFRRGQVLVGFSPYLLWSAVRGLYATQQRKRHGHVLLGHGMYKAEIQGGRLQALNWRGSC